jgi:hypothetical protein
MSRSVTSFLRTDGWREGGGRLLVVPDSDSIRPEFGT